MVRLIVYLILFFFSSPVYAYIDPGLGSLFLQSLIGGFAVFFGFISLFWQKIKSFFLKLRGNPKRKK